MNEQQLAGVFILLLIIQKSLMGVSVSMQQLRHELLIFEKHYPLLEKGVSEKA